MLISPCPSMPSEVVGNLFIHSRAEPRQEQQSRGEGCICSCLMEPLETKMLNINAPDLHIHPS
jgi:hypothetical protein